MKILNEKIVFNDKLIIEKAELSDGGKTISRLRINRPDASAVLVLNTDSKTILLTRQFRYAISSKTHEPIYEIVAGKIDPGEEPSDAAIRETEEEIGYRVRQENIELLVSCFASPGYSSEKFYIYFATVCNKDKISEGGGLETEHENIEVVEMKESEFLNLIDAGKIADAKTYMAGLLYKRNK
jgi:nudix-type nucleoside diphosphatase (YffH/AdpP family)